LSEPFVKLNSTSATCNGTSDAPFVAFCMASSRCFVSCASPCDNLNAAITASYEAASRQSPRQVSSRDTPHFVQRRRELIDKSAAISFFAKARRPSCPRAAANAPAYAETLPPPGVAAGVATASRNGAPIRQLPVLCHIHRRAAQRRRQLYFQTPARERSFQVQEKSAANFNRFFRTSPTISLPTGITP